MRMRKKPNLSSRMEKCSSLLVTDPSALRGRWLSFAQDQPRIVQPQGKTSLPNGKEPDAPMYGELRIELGCGKGRFTVETAKAEPSVLLVALEKSADAMVIAMERAAADEIQNARFVNAFADDVLSYFAPEEASRIYLNFCDPWPSNRHAKRRLTHRRFLELYAQILRPRGEVHFKTDNLPLFEFSLREFAQLGFEVSEETRDLHKDGPVGVMTDYEMKFFNQGLPICRCVAKR